MTQITFSAEQTVNSADVAVEDGGMAKIWELDLGEGDADGETISGMFLRLQSWSDHAVHTDFDALLGRRVRITVETVD